MKKLLKKILPKFILGWYHKCLALLATGVYLNPSNKLTVIGVTGTNGKSTTVNLIAELLQAKGRVGLTATTNFRIGSREKLNDQKMTMLGRFQTQKLLKQMVNAGCKYAIIETSSEGLIQARHLGINYDIVVFTNLTPEHIESHGGFDNYKKAKGRLFKHLTNRKRKIINQKSIPKIIIANVDDKHADYFLSFPADKKITFAINRPADVQARNIELKANGTGFQILNTKYQIRLLGIVNIYNTLAAVAIARQEQVPEETIREILFNYRGVPGRFEFIETNKNFKIMVDYAPEPESMRRLYETLKIFKFNKIIHVLGSCGGGRDSARRPILGRLAADNADCVIITNEDPYDDDPQMIINQVAAGAAENGKILNQNLFKILDRRAAIKKALTLAAENDLVLITGKGCEQYICVAHGQKIKWDDREVIRELLKNDI